MLMATEVSSLVRILSGYKEEEGEGKGERERNIVPCDFVVRRGGGAVGVDIDFQVPPAGSEKRLDSPSGRMHLQKAGPAPAPANRKLQDLNLPPPSNGAEAGVGTPLPEDSAALDLNLVAPAASEYHSVCTLEKVKYALERAERESRGKPHQRRMDGSPSSSSSSVATTSSIKRRGREEEVDGSDSSGGSLMAARCPRCLLYVLVANRDPRCPGCRSHVPVSAIYKKKPRIQLYSSFSDQL